MIRINWIVQSENDRHKILTEKLTTSINQRNLK